MVASPAYLAKHGRPERIDDLNAHRLLHYGTDAGSAVWKLTAPSGEPRQVRTAGGLSVNDGRSLLNAAISGVGIAYLPAFLYADAMAEGLVEDVLPDLPVETLGIHAVYPPGRFTQPKVRAFIDFLADRFGGADTGERRADTGGARSPLRSVAVPPSEEPPTASGAARCGKRGAR